MSYNMDIYFVVSSFILNFKSELKVFGNQNKTII